MRTLRCLLSIGVVAAAVIVLAGCPGANPAVDSPPVAEAVELATTAGSPIAIDLPGSDPEGNRITFRVYDGPQHGTIDSVSGERVTYTPAPGFVGFDSFRFVVDDGAQTSEPATVTITVYPLAAGDPVSLNVMEVVLVRDAGHMAAGQTARDEMLASTSVYQRLLAQDLGLYFLIREYPDPVSLISSPDPVTANDLLDAFRTWKNGTLDTGSGFEPTAVFHSDREWDSDGNAGLSFVGVYGSQYAVTVLRRRSGYTDLPFSTSLQIRNAAHQMGHVLGANHLDIDDAAIMDPILHDTDPADLFYLPDSIAAMEDSLDPLRPLQSIDAYALAGAEADGVVLLAWDEALPGTRLTLYRDDVLVPLSCFSCTELDVPASTSYFTDTTAPAGGTHRYRLVARNEGGEVVAVTSEVAVSVP